MIFRNRGNRVPRINGLSSPFGGLQWENKPSEEQVARNLLAMLEDRRVLYNPSEAESPPYCARSVVKVRDLLLSSGQKLDSQGVLFEQIRALAAACRKFLDRVDYDNPEHIRDITSFGHWRSWQFQDALGQLRGVFGVHIAVMAERYNLSVPDDLITILPEAPFEDELNG